MTSLTAPPPPAPGRRQVRWTNLVWVTWRQHRAALAGVFALLGGLSLLLVITGLQIRGAYASLGLNSCAGGTARCRELHSVFANEYFDTANQVSRFLEFVPMLIGGFIGAPLLARELESGTFRFAWTQGAGRTRWIVTRLVLLATVVTAAALAFSLLFSWWYRPFEPVISRMISGQAYEIEGIVFAARTLFGVALGALAGAAIRRVVPAMAATLAGWLAIVLPTVLYLRPHFRPPIATTAALSSQPASRFWQFQLIEGGGLLALAILLAAAALWLVRRA